MRIASGPVCADRQDAWLEGQCRLIHQAGCELALAVGEVNSRTEQALAGALGRRQRITESQFRQITAACGVLHSIQIAVQNALFDCEHELRELREQELSPAELLVDGERLIQQYRFLRRRARILDALLAYLPVVSADASRCRDQLHGLRQGADLRTPLTVPDCGFALVALDELGGEMPGER